MQYPLPIPKQFYPIYWGVAVAPAELEIVQKVLVVFELNWKVYDNWVMFDIHSNLFFHKNVAVMTTLVHSRKWSLKGPDKDQSISKYRPSRDKK